MRPNSTTQDIKLPASTLSALLIKTQNNLEESRNIQAPNKKKFVMSGIWVMKDLQARKDAGRRSPQ